MNKAVFLDRDGTINVEKNYLHKIEDFEFLPGVIEGLSLLNNAGYKLIIVTNQSGIGRGYYTENDFITLNNWMLDVLKSNGIIISKVYYCPHLPDAKVEKYRMDCECRKPKLGMYNQAIRDCAICEKTDCRGFLIANNEKPEIIEDVKNDKYKRVNYQSCLLDCAKYIINQN